MSRSQITLFILLFLTGRGLYSACSDGFGDYSQNSDDRLEFSIHPTFHLPGFSKHISIAAMQFNPFFALFKERCNLLFVRTDTE